MPAPIHGGGGAQATVTVNIKGNPQAAAMATQKALEQAIAKALRSKAVQSAVADMIKGISQAGKGNPLSGMFKNITAQAKSTTQSIQKMFDQLHKSAQKALSAQGARGASPELQTLQNHVIALTGNMNRLASASKQTMTAIEEVGRQTRAALRSSDQAARTSALTTTQSERLKIAQLQKEATQIRATGEVRRASISAFGQITLQTMRSVTRVIESTWKGATNIVRAFVRGAGAALRGLTRIATTVFNQMRQSAAASFRAMTMIFRGLGRGLAAAMHGVSAAFRSAFRGDESALRSSMARREGIVRSSMARMRATTSGGLNLPLIGGALAGGAGIGSLLTSGFERFGEEERLQLTFQTLLQDGPKATAVLQEISDFARTTAFDFVEVAGSVAQFTAAFGDVDRAFDITKFLADVVALTGGTTESLGRVRLAMTQIASAGRLDAANLKQITESLPGVPLAQILADRFFAGDLAAFSQARDAGDLGATITADAFFDAFMEGTQERFPEVEGFAQLAATTVSGMAANLKENFGILGASLISLVEGPLKSVMGRLNELMGLASDFLTGKMFEGEGPLTAAEEQAKRYYDLLINIRDFITGEMFATEPEGGGGRFQAENPYAEQAQYGQNVTIPFEELPPEMQDILHQRNGWEPNGGFVLAAQHAASLWEELHPPPELETEMTGSLERLKEIRDTVLDFFKGAGLGLALAGTLMLIGKALVFLTSPLTLAVIGFGLLNVVWQKIIEHSEKLQEAWAGLKAAIGPLIESFIRLGQSIFDALFGGEEGGAEDRISFWTKLGDAVGGFINTISGGLGWITRFVNQIAGLVEIGRADLIDDLLLIKLDELQKRLANFIGGILGISPEEIQAKGGGILGLLRNTFLEPVVNFFTDTLPGWIGWVRDRVTEFWQDIQDIWGAVFGGGEADEQAGPGQMFRNMETETTENTSWMGRLDTLLSGSFGGLSDAYNNVKEYFRPIFETVSGALSDAWGVIEPVIDPLIAKMGELVDAFKTWDFSGFDVGNMIQDALIGGVTGLAVGGPAGALVGAGIGALFGAGVGGALVDSINNLWTMHIEPALADLWTDIKNWFATTFTAGNMTSVGQDVLNGIRTIGFWIGKVVSDPRFVAALAIMAAGLALAIGAAILGAVQGVISNADEWGQILLDGLGIAFDKVKAEGPALFQAAITGLFTSPEIALGLGVGALLFGSGIGGKMISGITAFLGSRTHTGKMRVAMRKAITDAGLGTTASNAVGSLTVPQSGITRFFNKIHTGLGTAVTTGLTKLKSVGKQIGAGLVSGLIAFEAGNLAGRAGGKGSIILALLTGAGVGFAAGNLPGAIIGTALAGIGAAIGASGREAEQATEEIDEYVEAIRGLSDIEMEEAGARTILDNLRDTFTGEEGGAATLQFLRDAGFNATEFFRLVRDGAFQSEQVMGDFFRNLAEGTDLLDPAKFGGVEMLRHDLLGLGAAIETLGTGFGSFEELRHALAGLAETGDIAPGQFERWNVIIDELIAKGVDFDDIIDTLFDERGELRDALDIDAALAGLDETADAALNADGAIEEMLKKDPAKLADSVRGIGGAFADTEQAARDAEDAIAGFFDVGQYSGSVQAFRDELALMIPDLDEQFAAALEGLDPGGAAGQAAKSQFIGNTVDFLRDGLRTAIDSDVVTDQVSFDEFRAGVVAQIRASDLPTAIEEEMVAAYLAGTDDLGPLLDERAQAVAEAMATAMVGATKSKKGLREQAGKGLVDGILGPTGFRLDQATVDGVATNVESQLTPAINTGVTGAINAGGPTGFSTMATAGGPVMNAINAAGTTLGTEFGTSIVDAANAIIAAARLAEIAAPAPTTRDVSGISVPTPEADTGGSEGVGAGIGESIAAGLEGSAGAVADAAADIVDSVLDEFRSATGQAGRAGSAASRAFADGLGSQAGRVAGISSLMAILAVAPLDDGVGAARSAGAATAEGFRQGILSKASSIAQAAANLVRAAIVAAHVVLAIASPSGVFRTIGQQVGEGFIEGIADSEGDMTEALSSALTNAIDAAVEKAYEAVNRAQVAQKLFDILAPSRLPGGTPNADVLASQLRQRTSVTGFRSSLNEGAASALGATGTQSFSSAFRAMVAASADLTAALRENAGAVLETIGNHALADAWLEMATAADKLAGALAETADAAMASVGNPELAEARDAIRYIGRSVAAHVIDMREQYAEAQAARQALITYDADLKKIEADRRSGALGVREYHETLAEMRQQMATGELSAESFASQLEILNKKLNLGVLNAEAYEQAISELGDRPGALTYEQQQILRTSAHGLDPAFAGGQANRQMIMEQLASISDYGQAMIDSGSSAAEAGLEMRRLTHSLVNQLTSLGFNTTAVNKLVSEMGLSDAAIREFITTMTTLNTATEAGQANRDMIIESLESIKAWATEALAAGQSAASVVAGMKKYRDELVAELKALGFNSAAIAKIVEQLGLTNAALAVFQAGLTSLALTTTEGRANREAIMTSLESIRAWGQSALESGRSVTYTVATMKDYRDALVAQLRATGFSTAEIAKMVHELGLSDAALATFTAGLTSLNTGTVEGATNTLNLLEQFKGIRAFASEMLAAGIPVADVLANIRTMRDQIVNQAVAFGFNRQQVEALLATVGLSNAALAEFTAQMTAFETEAQAAADAANALNDALNPDPLNQAVAAPGFHDVHIHLPYGDPESVALATANRLAYTSLTAW